MSNPIAEPPSPAEHLTAARRAAETTQFPIGPSHRKRIGPAVSAVKHLLVNGLKPLHLAVLQPQRAFNEKLLSLLGSLVERGPAAVEPVREQLEPLADPRAWRLGPSPAPSWRRAQGLYVTATGLLLRRVLERQRQWNEAAIEVVAMTAQPPAERRELEAALGRLASLNDPLAPAGLPALTRAVFPVWRELLRPQVELNQLVAQLLARLHAPPERLFHTRGYAIPERLVRLTGGGPETWEDIIRLHLDEYTRYCPIRPDHHVLEVGCGVGRDAMALTELLSPEGRYIGVDIIEPSIRWCAQNITPRHPSFRFFHLDIQSQIHSPNGALKVTEVSLPAESGSIDRIILQSVFTHMFKADIIHYLREFRRVLRPEGLAFASFFILDDEALQMARKANGPLTFRHPYGEGCWVNDPVHPEGAVGYSRAALDEMLAAGGMKRVQPIHPGNWCGRQTGDGQDIAILAAA